MDIQSPYLRSFSAEPFALLQTAITITKIKDIFESMLNALILGKELTITLKCRGPAADQYLDDDYGAIMNSPDGRVRAITFPGRNEKEARTFAILAKILEVSLEALMSGNIVTKRDIYYQDPELFKKQAVVDRCVDDLAQSLDVGRNALNIVAAARGLVAGSLRIHRQDGTTLTFATEDKGVLIPSIRHDDVVDFSAIRWILVIEKEAIFRTLTVLEYWSCSLAGQGLLVTGKGYPDIQTRTFLRFLSHQPNCPPIFALVDFDPDGLAILSTYKYGSRALAHENRDLALPSLRWLGPRSSDLTTCLAAKDHSARLSLSSRDRRMITLLLRQSRVFDARVEPAWRKELQVMAMLNLKGEIEVLGSGAELVGWLDGMLCRELDKIFGRA